MSGTGRRISPPSHQMTSATRAAQSPTANNPTRTARERMGIMSGDRGMVRTEPRNRLAQPFLKRNAGLPAEQRVSFADIGSALSGIIHGEWVEFQTTGGSLQVRQHLLRNLQDGALIRIAEIHGIVEVAVHQPENPLDEIADVTEAARLTAVAIDGQWLVPQCLPDKVGTPPPVTEPHPLAVRVEDANNPGIQPMLAMIGHRERFGESFGFIVHAARPDRVDMAPVMFRLRMDLRIAVDLRGGGEEEFGPRGFGDP